MERFDWVDLEREGNGEVGPNPLIVEDQEVVVVNTARDGFLANIRQAMLDHHLRLAGNQANSLLIEVTVAGGRIHNSLGENDRSRLCLNRPFAVINDVIEAEHAVFRIVGLAQNADADFEERPTWLSFTEPEPFFVGGKFFRRSGDRAAGAGDNIVALVDI